MPFIAECVFCATKVKVPDNAAGTSKVCPHCHSSFTIVPAAKFPTTTPVRPRKLVPTVAPTAPIFAVPAAGLKATRKTRAAPASDDPTEIGIQPSAGSPYPVAPSESAGDQTEVLHAQLTAPELPPPPETVAARPKKRRRRISILGTIAFLLGSVALVSASFSALDFLAVPLSAAGLACGVLGLLLIVLGRKRGLLVPLAGSAVSLAVLLVAWLFPSWFGIVPAPQATGLHLTGKQTVVARSNSGLAAREDAPEWFDVSRGALQQDDVRLRITSVAVEWFDGPISGKPRSQRERGLVVHLRLSNSGADRRIDYEPWGMKHLPVLTDNAGKSYPLRSFAAGIQIPGQARGTALFPGKTVDDLLVFEVPPATIEYLHLELPASACASPGKFRLLIPKSQIRR